MNTFTNGKIYIIDIDAPSERIELQFAPQDISNKRTVDIAKIKAIGRNNPISQAIGGDEDFSFNTEYRADDGDTAQMLKQCNWLKSLSYDRKKIKFILGDLFTDYEFYISNIGITYLNLVAGQNYNPLRAKIDISLQIANKTDFTAKSIRK